jgi:hypothetical protein
MKVTVDVSDGGGKTLFVESFYDLSEVGMPAIQLAREVAQLMVAYPTYKTITVEIEKDADDARADLQEPLSSECGTKQGMG